MRPLNQVIELSEGPKLRKRTRIDLGLSLLNRHCIYGVPLDQGDIAAWAGCAKQNISQIEEKAMRKLRSITPRELLDQMEALLQK